MVYPSSCYDLSANPDWVDKAEERQQAKLEALKAKMLKDAKAVMLALVAAAYVLRRMRLCSEP